MNQQFSNPRHAMAFRAALLSAALVEKLADLGVVIEMTCKQIDNVNTLVLELAGERKPN